MIGQETDLTVDDRMERLTDMGQSLAAIIAITRRDWMSHGHALPSPDWAAVNRTRSEDTLFEHALEAERSCSS